MEKELKNKRINVRANESMINRIAGIRAFLDCTSDSETLELILSYLGSGDIDYHKLRMYYVEKFKK